MGTEVSNARDEIDAERRKLTFEQDNVQDLSDQIRELKGVYQNETVVRRDLEERLKDEREMLQAQFDEEKRALKIIADSKLTEGVNLDSVLSEVGKAVESSEGVKRLKSKIDELESKIKMEREENERIQGELSTSFMEKITRYDEMIQNLKARLGED
jgi:peptidoglycan hydrolase CwlO-like protein